MARALPRPIKYRLFSPTKCVALSRPTARMHGEISFNNRKFTLFGHWPFCRPSAFFFGHRPLHTSLFVDSVQAGALSSFATVRNRVEI